MTAATALRTIPGQETSSPRTSNPDRRGFARRNGLLIPCPSGTCNRMNSRKTQYSERSESTDS